MRYDIIQNAARSLVIAIALLMLIVFGATLVEVTPGGLTTGEIASGRTNSGPALRLLVFSGDAGGMASGPGTSSERSIFLDIPALVTWHNFENGPRNSVSLGHRGVHKIDWQRYADLTTTAAISSRKALEFTLVGAKPSGTS